MSRDAGGDGRRTERRVVRWVLRAGAAAVGLALSTVHWGGLLVGGALVSLPARSLPRGVIAGAAFGFLAWVVFAVGLVAGGSFDRFLATRELAAVSAVVAVGVAGFGGLARGLGR